MYFVIMLYVISYTCVFVIKDAPLHVNKLEPPLDKGGLCQVLLKLASDSGEDFYIPLNKVQVTLSVCLSVHNFLFV